MLGSQDMDTDSNSMLLKLPSLLFPTQPLSLGYGVHSAKSLTPTSNELLDSFF